MQAREVGLIAADSVYDHVPDHINLHRRLRSRGRIRLVGTATADSSGNRATVARSARRKRSPSPVAITSAAIERRLLPFPAGNDEAAAGPDGSGPATLSCGQRSDIQRAAAGGQLSGRRCASAVSLPHPETSVRLRLLPAALGLHSDQAPAAYAAD